MIKIKIFLILSIIPSTFSRPVGLSEPGIVIVVVEADLLDVFFQSRILFGHFWTSLKRRKISFSLFHVLQLFEIVVFSETVSVVAKTRSCLQRTHFMIPVPFKKLDSSRNAF